MKVAISSMALAQIRAESRGTPDEEICGLLLGTGGAIREARVCHNVAADRSCRFEIDPAVLFAAHRAARNGEFVVLGHYHSHPAGSTEPSPRDAADAVPDGAIWLIAASNEVRAWRAVDDGAVHGRFDPIALVSVSPCAGESGASEGAQTPLEE